MLLFSLVAMMNDKNMYDCFFMCSNQTDEPLPDIMWCREPFMEVLNEIKDIK